MSKLVAILVTFCILNAEIHTTLSAKPEPAKILNNGVYRLEIQSEDKFLTSTENGTAVRSQWKSRPDQKWKFSLINDAVKGPQGWMIGPISGQPGIPTLWRISYVGHGKFRFTSQLTQLCLAGIGSSAVGERKCEKDSPYQRWLVVETKP